MAVTFNPFTGQLDITGAGSGTALALRYTQTFNNTTDWTLAAPDYTITITAATHGKGINPNVQVFEQVGLNYDVVNVVVEKNASGDVTIKVAQIPDNRFNGFVLIV